MSNKYVLYAGMGHSLTISRRSSQPEDTPLVQDHMSDTGSFVQVFDKDDEPQSRKTSNKTRFLPKYDIA